MFGLVTASIVFGLASQDTAEQALAELGMRRAAVQRRRSTSVTRCTRTPRCSSAEPSDERDDAGVVRFHHWGLLDDERVVFEGRRTVLLKRRSHWVASS